FGDNFNQPLEIGVFPNELTRLIFGRNFNQIIKLDVLPINLTNLEFSNIHMFGGISIFDNNNIDDDSFFDQPIERNILPNKLITLHLADNFNHTIEPNILP